MSETTSDATVVVSARCEQRVYPPYDSLHGTPNAMLWRKVTIETPRGSAAFEQTDLRPPGPAQPVGAARRGARPTARLSQLQAAAESLAALQV